ncbi:MAG: type VI secretion system baseplate subunit TssF [Desulfobacterium sp.]|nr:type VI secretion system baseplate subunit TssF [Desulfobacterium sp.]
MDDTFLNYYEQELSYLRQMGAEFAAKHPKIASRLLLEPDVSTDPHTERLIEAFAFISGRIHKKIDDDFPEITESLFNIIYPHYNNPIPSMTIARFDPLGQNIPESGYTIDRGAKLFSKPVNGTPCQFVTSQAMTLWPVEVVSATLKEPSTMVTGAHQMVSLHLKTIGDIPVAKLGWSRLRFYLHGQHQHVFHLHELLFNHVCHVECRTSNGQGPAISLGKDAIETVGFEEEERLLPFSKRSFPGYRLLFEYFCFPEKFFFFDLTGLDRLQDTFPGVDLEIRIYLDRSAKTSLMVNADTFTLNATPIVNLFSKTAEPIRVEQRKTEYRVIPDIRRQEATEVYSIDRVSAASQATGKPVEYRPFYSVRHHLDQGLENTRQAFWHFQRRASGKRADRGTEVFLSFSDLNLTPEDPACDILTVHTTCTNRDLAARLPMGDVEGDFTMETAAPIERIRGMIKSTPTRRPFLGGTLQWRLISHLSLNFISLVQGGEDALREMLMLYDFDNSPATKQQISGIVRVESVHVTRRIHQSFCRGVQVTITLDENKFVGAGLYLFSSILERFLGQYVSVNSFSQLAVKTLQQKETLKLWPPRSGNQILL